MSRPDLCIRGANVVDGTGAAMRRADVCIKDGRITSIDESPGEAVKTIDADGLVLSPGFVDPHTHYDAQLGWDPTASPSNLHGVTTVIGGNCGFSIAPLGVDGADYIRRMMSVVEGMPLEALESGLDWSWTSFGQWLDRLEGQTAVNAAFLVGHCALRRTIMGEEAVGNEATEEQLQRMRVLLRESLADGAIGLSSSRSFTHRDWDGNPVPSRAASEEELLALCRVVGEQDGTSLEFITDGCLQGFSDREVALMARMSLEANRPLNWNVFTIDSTEPARFENQLRASEEAAEQGARIVALTMPTLVGMTMSFLTYSPIHQLPGWRAILGLPLAERITALRSSEVRAKLLAGSRSPEAGVFLRVADFSNFRIGETFSRENEGLTGRLVKEVAAERTTGDFDTLIDIALADDLRSVFWPEPPDDDEASWRMRQRAWNHEHTLLGGSDAGAHLDRMCGAPYTTEFLADCIRGRKLMSLEAAVHKASGLAADHMGFADRGRIAAGMWADLVAFDPDTVIDRATIDQPHAPSLGISHVWVNGELVQTTQGPTDARPGKVLRRGRATTE
jgi:N-acyl-D-aspartate/D-glutamate deacylase